MNHISQLIYKYIVGSISQDERAELNQWLKDQKNQEVFNRLTNLNNLENEFRMRNSIDSERPMNDMQARIERENSHQKKERTKIRPLLRLASAAAIALLIVGVGYQSYKLGLNSSKTDSTDNIAQATSITHGQTKAILTLDNGETVELGSDSHQNEQSIKKLLNNSDLKTETFEQIQTLNLKTPRGGEFKITLEDGTEVWLNAESQLQYPEVFEDGERRVTVSGEAYFKVAKDIERPFYVETAGQLVRVYGTEFNILSYQEDSNIYTTLVNGSIALSPINGNGSSVLLTPGHQAVFDKNNVSSSIRSVDTSIVTSWRNGKFVFENQSLEQIMISLSRWYDFEYEFKDPGLRNTIFMGSVPRYGQFSEVLSILEKSGGLYFTQKGKTIIIHQK